ncbi:MAG: hypothetical protein ACREHF_07895, partial [Rhizomicrobium sp.]
GMFTASGGLFAAFDATEGTALMVANAGLAGGISGYAATGKLGKTVLHAFGSSGTDGIGPDGPLTYATGRLYGVTANGGTKGDGTVYKLRPCHCKSMRGALSFRCIQKTISASHDGSTPGAEAEAAVFCPFFQRNIRGSPTRSRGL